jgi:hypothetical protein
MLDPVFLDLLERDPAIALGEYALDPALVSEFSRLDWSRVRGFAGMAAKVQNNGLWQHFFYTRTLLANFKLDNRLFVAYRRQHLENRKEGLSRDAQTDRFLQFLRTYIHSLSDNYPGLSAVIQHEHWAWEIAKSLSCQPSKSNGPPARNARPSDHTLMNAAITINGVIRVGEFKHDPLQIVAMVDHGHFDPKALVETSIWRCYWGDPASGELRILESDANSATVLNAVNGCQCAKDILRSTTESNSIQAKLFLRQAFKIGLVSYVTKQNRTRGSHAGRLR